MGKQFNMTVFFKWLLCGKMRCFAAASKALLRKSLWLVLFLLGWASAAQATIPASERAVLTELYASTNGASWTNNTGWMGAEGTECSWYGITCDATQQHVIGIDLRLGEMPFFWGNNLAGVLPTLSGLSALQFFIVSRNNMLTGSIPSLSGLSALQSFDVSDNQLSGSIPSLNGLSALQSFDVRDNQLTGSIPPLDGLTALQTFHVDYNQLSGTLPSLSGLTNLQYFTAVGLFKGNLFTGTIPSLSGLSALQLFDVSANQLTGSIPSLSGLTALQQFNVSGNELTGAIPSFSGLSALQLFYVSGNQLTGTIPSLSGLSALQWFHVRDNLLMGAIPSLNGLTALEIFDASGNQMTGSIPALSGLTALGMFDVNFNQLTGSIPTLSGLTVLQTFSVKSNQLTGSIPALSELTALQRFEVDGNQLTGTVPAVPISMVAGQSNLCSNSLVSSGNSTIDAGWVTAQGSDWLICQAGAVTTYALTTDITGTGAGSVSPTTVDGTGINCYVGSCTASYRIGASVTLMAIPASGSTFTGWSGGGCSGMGNCTIIMNAAQSVTATFMKETGTQSGVSTSERAVLASLYASTNGAAWTNKTGWMGAAGTECSWFGVTCDGTQSHVVSIQLISNNLVGTLPSLSGLTALQDFDAQHNQLTGALPSLSGMSALKYFNVDYNQFTGSIPSFSGLTALESFHVAVNQLTGSIPSLSSLTALQMFDVIGNQLTGPVPAAPASLVAGYSNLCGNSLVSSGNPTIDAAWVKAQNAYVQPGGDWLACQTIPSTAITLTGLELTCPANMTAGSSGNCAAMAVYSDGNKTAVTTATWTVTPSGAATVGATGTVTAAKVSADTPITVNASFTENGKTVSATKTITLKAAACFANTGEISIDGAATKRLGESLDVRYRLCGYDKATPFDVYVAVQIPTGELYFLSSTGGFFGNPAFSAWDGKSKPAAYLANTLISDMEGTVLNMPALPATLPTGAYTFYAVPVLKGADVMNGINWVDSLSSGVVNLVK